MVEFTLTQTDDHEELINFFIENELEVPDEDPVPTYYVKCWKIADENKLVGAIALAKREGEFIIDGIAVDAGYRKKNLGKLLLDKAIEETRKASGTCIYLVARTPGFFKRQGFIEISKETAPNFFECLDCPQFEKSCYPEIMKLSL